MYWSYNRIDDAGSLAINGANTLAFQPGGPIDIKRVIAVVTTGQTSAAAEITFGVRDADAGNSETLGTFEIPVAAADAVYYANVAGGSAADTTGADNSVVNGPKDGVVQVNPGQEFFLTSDGGGDGGVVEIYIEYIVQGFSGSRVEDAIEAEVTFS